MSCSICGKDVPADNQNCPNCGTPLEPIARTAIPAGGAAPGPADGTADGSPPGDEEPVLEPMPGEFQASVRLPATGSAAATVIAGSVPVHRPARKGKRRTILIAVALLVVLLAGGGLFAWKVFGRDIRRFVLGPKKTYLLAEGASLKGSLDRIASDWSTISSQASQPAGGTEAQVTVQLDPALTGIPPEIARTVSNLKLKSTFLFDRRLSGPKVYSRADLLTGSEPLLGVELFLAEDQMTVGLPGLIDPYIAVRMDSLSGTAGQSLSRYLKQNLEATPAVDQTQLAASLARLADDYVSRIESVSFADNMLVTAGGVTAPYECYTVTMSGKQTRDLAVAILERCRDDKPLRDLLYPYMRNILYSGLSGMPPLSGEARTDWGDLAVTDGPISEQNWKDLMTKAIDALKAAKDEDLKDVSLNQRVYMDKQDRIIGREIMAARAGADAESATLKVLAPLNNGQQGLLLSLAAYAINSSDPIDLQLSARFERKDGLDTGSAEVVSAGKTALKASFRGLGLQDFNGMPYPVGEADLEFVNQSPDMPGSLMPESLPKISVTGAVRDGHYAGTIALAGNATIGIDLAVIAAADVKIPSLSGKDLVQSDDEEAMAELMSGDFQEKVMQILDRLDIDPFGLMAG